MDRDELRTCPYDKGHQVRSSRFEIHLIKCKRVTILKNFG